VHRKINRPIGFPGVLDLSGYSSAADDGEDPPQTFNYRINGIVVHEGVSLSCGHYIAYARSSDGQFYGFDDSYVYRANTDRVGKAAAYLLFYVRVPVVSTQPVSSFRPPNGYKNVPSPVPASPKPSSLLPQKRPFIGPQLPSPQANGSSSSSAVNSPKVIIINSFSTKCYCVFEVISVKHRL
jgi:hypothetical protein